VTLRSLNILFLAGLKLVMSTDKVDRVIAIVCHGGPRDQSSFRVVNPPPAKIRFAFPEWCTYEFGDGAYHYIGDVKIDEAAR